MYTAVVVNGPLKPVSVDEKMLPVWEDWSGTGFLGSRMLAHSKFCSPSLTPAPSGNLWTWLWMERLAVRLGRLVLRLGWGFG